MRLLDRYIARGFLLGVLPVMLLLTGLFSFLALTEQLDDVGKGGFTSWSALKVVMLTLPRQVLDILPVITLLGTLTGLGAMANHREIVAARAAGLSPTRVAKPVAFAALLVVVIALLVQSYGIPQWERRALQLRNQVTQTDLDGADYDFWTRTGGRLLRVGEVAMGRIPTDIEIYQLDDQDRVVSLIRAERADLGKGDEWLLHNVTESEIGTTSATTTIESERRWRSFLSEAQLKNLIQPAGTLSPSDLLRYIHNLDSNRLNSHQFRLALWQMVSLPVGIIAMALLGVPFVMGSLRSVSIGQRIALGGGIGMVFYLTEQIVSHLSVLYELNPPIAALAPEAVLLLLAWRGLRKAR